MVSIIITSKNKASLEKMRKLGSKYGRVKDNLPIINGFSAEVDLKTDFFKVIPANENNPG